MGIVSQFSQTQTDTSSEMNTTIPSAAVDPRPSVSMFLIREAFHSVFGGLVALVAVFLLSIYTKPSSRRILPPGPKGVPFFGNLFQLMATPQPWKTFADWGKQYGPLVHLNIAGKNMIIMNTHKVAADLLDRRATIYSSRPNLIVASEMLTGGMLLAFQGYTDLWRRMRRAAHEGLNSNAAKNYHAAQEKEAILLVQGVLKDSNNWDDEVKRATASMILGAIYDIPTVESCHDPQVAYVNNFVNRFVGAASPKAHYVEYFTWMKYIPSSMAKWKREALEWYKRDSEYLGKMYGAVKGRLRNGEESTSFAASLIRDDKHLGLSDLESSWLAATIYAAGSETSSTVMAWFILAMIAYPEVQKKAQEELDAVVGRDRMPTFADRDSLPYINACVREALRWRALTPMGAPHETVEDDWYEGYFIPKGTVCFANQWAMNRDTDVYGADSDEFRPERHLDQDGQVACPYPDTHDGHVSYGFGRRICVGRHVATNGLFINIASLLWAATVAPVTDHEGHPQIPDTFDHINNGLVLRPIPFKCNVKSRFKGAEAIVSQTRESFHS